MPDSFYIEEITVPNRAVSNIKKYLISIIPWIIVGSLLWVGLFVKQTVTIEEVSKPAFERRDNIFGVDVIDGNNIWLCGNYGKILRSSDGGSSWESQETGTNRHLQDISSWDDKRAVAVGNGGIVLITEDGGKSWNEIDVPRSDIANKLIRIHTYKSGEALAVGEYGMILRTQDYGQSWKQLREGEDVILNDVAKVGGNKIIAVGEFGTIFISQDDGQTWSEVEKTIEHESSLMAIEFANDQEGIAVGLDGLVIKTDDGGDSWYEVDGQVTNINDHLMDVVWDGNREKWFAVGNKGRWLEANADFSSVISGIFDKKDLSWHTEVNITGQGYIVVGANVGKYSPENHSFEIYSNKLVR